MKDKTYYIFIILLSLIFGFLIFVLDGAYDRDLPKIFWFVLILIYWLIRLKSKKNKRIVILASLSAIIMIQICLLLFPYFYNIIFNLFNKISFT